MPAIDFNFANSHRNKRFYRVNGDKDNYVFPFHHNIGTIIKGAAHCSFAWWDNPNHWQYIEHPQAIFTNKVMFLVSVFWSTPTAIMTNCFPGKFTLFV